MRGRVQYYFLGVGVVFKSRLSGSGDGEFGPSRKALN